MNKFDRSQQIVGRVSPNVGQTRPNSPKLWRTSVDWVEIGPNLGSRDNCSTTWGQLLGNFGASEELAVIARSLFSGLVSSICSVPFGELRSLCHARPLPGRRHYKPHLVASSTPTGLSVACSVSHDKEVAKTAAMQRSRGLVNHLCFLWLFLCRGE